MKITKQDKAVPGLKYLVRMGKDVFISSCHLTNHLSTLLPGKRVFVNNSGMVFEEEKVGEFYLIELDENQKEKESMLVKEEEGREVRSFKLPNHGVYVAACTLLATDMVDFRTVFKELKIITHGYITEKLLYVLDQVTCKESK